MNEEYPKLTKIIYSLFVYNEDVSKIISCLEEHIDNKDEHNMINEFYKCYMGTYLSAEDFIKSMAESYCDGIPDFIYDAIDFKKIADDLCKKDQLILMPCKDDLFHVFVFYNIRRSINENR